MLCENCGKEITENSKFCTYCGAAVQKQKLFKTSTEPAKEIYSESKTFIQQEQPKVSEKLEKICNHLEFLGYQIEKIKGQNDKEKDTIIATHSQKNNIVAINLSSNLTLFKISLTTEKKHSAEMDKFINEANRILVFAKVYCEPDKDTKNIILRLEAIYTGDYQRESFGEFIESFNSDGNPRLLQLPNADKLFLS